MGNKIVVFGSVNRDHVYTMDHLVRPGETISSSNFHVFWGGKGLNQAIALSKAGAETFLAAKVNLGERAELGELCEKSGVNHSQVIPVDYPTGHAIIQVDRLGQNGIFVYSGANGTVNGRDIESVLSCMGKGDILLLQNEINSLPEIIRTAHSRAIRVALNPSPVSPEMRSWPLDLVDILIVNETEACALSGERDPGKIMDGFRGRYPHGSLLLTLGAEGSYYQDIGQRLYQKAFHTEVVDTTAAGDTFTGFFLACVMAGETKQQALRMAAKAAAIAVSRQGATVSIPTLEETRENTKVTE